MTSQAMLPGYEDTCNVPILCSNLTNSLGLLIFLTWVLCELCAYTHTLNCFLVNLHVHRVLTLEKLLPSGICKIQKGPEPEL